MTQLLWAFGSGALFSIGLGLAGMTDPAKVQGFLDVTGAWNPQLAFVMGGALVVHAGLRLLLRKTLAQRAPPIPKRSVDGRLIGGAALFGVGWGLAGYCPGPALTSLVTGQGQVLAFVGAMLVGMAAVRRLERVRSPSVPSSSPDPAAELPASF